MLRVTQLWALFVTCMTQTMREESISHVISFLEETVCSGIYFSRVQKNIQGSSGDLFGVDDAFTGGFHITSGDSYIAIYNSSNIVVMK